MRYLLPLFLVFAISGCTRTKLVFPDVPEHLMSAPSELKTIK